MPLLPLHLLLCGTAALDNGLRVPPMGWSSWYGFTSNINETLFREIGDGLISSGLKDVGWSKVWISDGWAIGRDNVTGHIIEDPRVFPSGMKATTDYLHARGLSVGMYTSVGPLTVSNPTRAACPRVRC